MEQIPTDSNRKSSHRTKSHYDYQMQPQSTKQGFRKCSSQFSNLLSPFRPIIGGHCISEAGGSTWIPTFLLLLWRLTCTCASILALVLFSATGDIQYQFIGSWTFLATSLAWMLATFSSLRYMLFPETAALSHGKHSYSLLANLTVPIYQIFLTSGLIIDLLYWTVLREREMKVNLSEIVVYILSTALLFVDSLISFRMNFRFWYMVASILFAVVWIGFSWTWRKITGTQPYTVGDTIGNDIRRTVLIQLSLAFGHLISGAFVLLVNRINRIPLVSHKIDKICYNDAQLTDLDEGDFLEYDREEDDFREMTSEPPLKNFKSYTHPLPLYDPEGRSDP